MKFGILISVIALFLANVPAYSQTRNNWDESLDRYELICERCIELIRQRDKGDSVPQESINSLTVQISMLRNSLNAGKGSMSTAQKARFDMIRSRLASNLKDKKSQLSKVHTNQSLKSNSFASKPVQKQANPETTDIDTLIQPKSPSIAVMPTVSMTIPESISITEQSPEIIKGYYTSPTNAPEKKMSFLLSADIAVWPALSYGLMFGAMWGKIGAYINCRSNFVASVPYSYSCDMDGNIPGGGKIWRSGISRKSRSVVSVGTVLRASKSFRPYIGLGYGQYGYYLEDTDGKWAKVTNATAKGLNINLGLMFVIKKRLAIGIGADITQMKYTDLNISLGLTL